MPEKSYFVRTCIRNEAGQLVSPSSWANGFIWSEKVGSVVTCPDWDPDERCGGGLHGLRPGDGNPVIWATGPNAVWLVCSYDPETVVDLGGKIKVPSCVVEYVVDEKNDAKTKVPMWLKERGVLGPIHGAILVNTYGLTQVGDAGIAIAGLKGESIAGDYGSAMVGASGKATAGSYGVAIATAWESQATTQLYGTSLVGSRGKAQVGYGGHAIAGPGGQAKAGMNGMIQIRWSDPQQRIRIAVGYIGENGLEPDVFYKLDKLGNFTKVDPCDS